MKDYQKLDKLKPAPKTLSRDEMIDIIKHHSVSQVFLEQHTANEMDKVFKDIEDLADALIEAGGIERANKETIEIRDISVDKIKEEMLVLLADGKTRYIDEIAEELAVDIKDALKAFEQLQKEKKVFIALKKLKGGSDE